MKIYYGSINTSYSYFYLLISSIYNKSTCILPLFFQGYSSPFKNFIGFLCDIKFKLQLRH